MIFHLRNEKTNREILALELKCIPYKIYFGVSVTRAGIKVNYIKIQK